MNRLSQYFSDLSAAIGSGWNRFWFSSADALPLAVLRIGAGLAALYYQFSHTADLVRWFGPGGLLPIAAVRELTGAQTELVFHPSLFYATDVPELLWTLHVAGYIAALLMTIGLFSRLSTVLTLAMILSYVHRAPMITGPVEPILTMLLCYLCLAPTGRFLSLDRLLGLGKTGFAAWLLGTGLQDESWTANLSLRLIQVHLAGFYLMMGLTRLAGTPWWDGTAVWLLLAHTDSRIVDLTGLAGYPYLLEFLTHSVVFFELSFGLLIWNRLARPLLLLLAVPMWLLLAVVSGELAFGATMLVANLAFVPAETWRGSLADKVTR